MRCSRNWESMLHLFASKLSHFYNSFPIIGSENIWISQHKILWECVPTIFIIWRICRSSKMLILTVRYFCFYYINDSSTKITTQSPLWKCTFNFFFINYLRHSKTWYYSVVGLWFICKGFYLFLIFLKMMPVLPNHRFEFRKVC